MRPYVDDGMLREIAEADYGVEADTTYAVLRRMRDDPHHTGASDFQTSEVLELIRWSEPDDPEWKPGGHGIHGHWMRAFCCAWLLREIAEDGGFVSNAALNETIIQLIGSVARLPIVAWLEVGALLEWSADESALRDGQDDQIFFALASFWCGLRCAAPAERLETLSRWIVDETRIGAVGHEPTPLFQSEIQTSMRRQQWENLGAEMERFGRGLPDGRVAERATLIGARMKDC